MKKEILILCILISHFNFAQTHIWTGNGGDNDWFNTSNWNSNTLPDATSEVFIPDGFTVVIDGSNSAAVNSLELEGAADFTISSDLSISNEFLISQISQVFFLEGVISGGGTIENLGLFEMSTFTVKEMSGITFNNRNEMRVFNSNQILTTNGMTIHNYPEGEISIESAGGLTEQGSTATLINEGLLRKWEPDESSSVFYLVFDIENTGVIEVGKNQSILILVTSNLMHNMEDGSMQGEGIFDITANFVNEGKFAPAGNQIGSISITNFFNMSGNAQLEIDIAGILPEEYDTMDVFGAPSLSGTVVPNLTTAALNVGDEIEILSSEFDITLCDFPSEVNASFDGLNFTFEVLCESRAVKLKVSEVMILNTNEFESADASFYVVPNPITDKANFVFSSEIFNDPNYSLSIFNFLGQKIVSVKDLQPLNTFNRGSLPAGIYFVELKKNNRTIATQKLVMR